MNRETEGGEFCKIAKAIIKEMVILIGDLVTGENVESIDVKARAET